jgi:hypothetical protein
VERLRATATRDAADRETELRCRAESRRGAAAEKLAQLAGEEANALKKLLIDQLGRIAKLEATFDDRQLTLDLDPAEAEQVRRDRRRWQAKCGDSLVGLDARQIAAMHWDASKPGLPLFR